ncbi:hypothetical protein [Paenibacillus brevis]|uniref:Glycine zipper-like domain-containing protein n=1 Tax=Paenibacillus brevis TaxID=2841508 RepID=A0ABS6FTG4_9BACL|nr:hypothetical protein [Paenibacillus brevis]MBU5673226.1 hypothetical protein [Paenibacillus brevis]
MNNKSLVTGVSLGLCFSVVFGAALKSIPLGITFGIIFGVVFFLAEKSKSPKEE